MASGTAWTPCGTRSSWIAFGRTGRRLGRCGMTSEVLTGAASLTCRFCEAPLEVTFCDLGMSPLANSYVAPESLHRAEATYPLHVYVCSSCLLVQVPMVETAEHIFSDYLYFSSYS